MDSRVQSVAFSLDPLTDGPIIHVDHDSRLEGNVNGPSLIVVPSWVDHPLGRYYLYFAHHEGRSIRLAYANDLAGPWTLHEPGALQLEDSSFPATAPNLATLHPQAKRWFEAGIDPLYPHIASPEVIVEETQREIRMYYHGRLEDGTQMTRVAVSNDGLHFTIQRRKPRPLGVVRDNRLCLTKVFGPKHWFSTWAGIAPIPIEAERTVISTFIS